MKKPEVSAKVLTDFAAHYPGFKPEIVTPPFRSDRQRIKWAGGVAFKAKLVQVDVYEALSQLGTLWYSNGRFYFHAKEEGY